VPIIRLVAQLAVFTLMVASATDGSESQLNATTDRVLSAKVSNAERSYLMGMAHYIVRRGYVIGELTTITSENVTISWQLFAVADQNGNDGKIVIPEWKTAVMLKRREVAIGDNHYTSILNQYSIRNISSLDEHVGNMDNGNRLECSVQDIDKTDLNPFEVSVNRHQKEAIIHLIDSAGQQIRPPLSRFCFSKIYCFENVIWVYDRERRQLHRFASENLLNDQINDAGTYPNALQYDIAHYDVGGEFLSNYGTIARDVLGAFGLWACLSEDEGGE
jgi:hypothetical protein